MLSKITLVLLLIMVSPVFGNQHNKIDTLGVSKLGQFVALEEYGYKPNTHSYFVTIRILNVWTKKYVGSTVEVEEPAHQPVSLEQAREKAKKMASENLKKFNILG